MEFYIEKIYCNMKKVVFYKMCLNVQKNLKWILFTVSEKENVYSVRDGFPLKVVNLQKTLKKGSLMRF